MKSIIASMLLLSSMSSFATDPEVLKAIDCFEYVSIEIGVNLTEALDMAPNAQEAAKIQAKIDKFYSMVEDLEASTVLCSSNVCLVNTYLKGTNAIAKKYNSLDIVKATPSCNF